MKLKWSPEDDAHILRLYELNGPDWPSIAESLKQSVSNKHWSPKQVRNRFYKRLVPRISPASRWQCVKHHDAIVDTTNLPRKRPREKVKTNDEQYYSTDASTPSVKESAVAFHHISEEE